MKNKLVKRLKKLPARTKILAASLLVAGLALIVITHAQVSQDIKPTIYTCSTPLGAFQVSNEQIRIRLEDGRYILEDDNQEVSVAAVNCVSQRAK